MRHSYKKWACLKWRSKKMSCRKKGCGSGTRNINTKNGEGLYVSDITDRNGGIFIYA